MSGWHGGKGSAQRKMDKQKYNDNWDIIFGNKKPEDVKNERDKENEIQTTRDEHGI